MIPRNCVGKNNGFKKQRVGSIKDSLSTIFAFNVKTGMKRRYFVDVEGTKEVKRMINLLAITVNLYHEIDADPSGSGSKTDRVRK